MRLPVCDRRSRLLLLALIFHSSLRAQQALYVSDGEHSLRLVRKMDHRDPYILEKKGALALPAPYDSAAGNLSRRYKLQPVEEFLPAFVAARIIKADFSHLSSESVRRLDWRFQFTAAFSTNARLSDVFFVVEFDTADAERKYLVQEVPAKDLQQARPISVEVSLSSVGTMGKYELHVFSGGLEVFHSGMTRPFIEEALRKMVAKRIAGVREGNPRPLAGPIPRYPEKLLSTRAKGQATISCVIGADGQPQDAKIKSASDPAFADAALATMPEWWFVPKVTAGKPVASAADLPFEFAPPRPGARP